MNGSGRGFSNPASNISMKSARTEGSTTPVQSRHCATFSLGPGSLRLEIHRHDGRLHALRMLLPLLLPIVEKRNRHLGVLGVGVMYRLGIMSQWLLGEAFRIAALKRPLRPGVTVGVQRHALD